MSIVLTKGESYLIGKENNIPVIIESSDSAGAIKQFNHALKVSGSNDGTGTIETVQNDSSIFRLYSNANTKEVLKLGNYHNGSNADTYLEFHNQYLNDAWDFGIDASIDHAICLHKGNTLGGGNPNYKFGTSAGASHFQIGKGDGVDSSITIFDGDTAGTPTNNRIILGATEAAGAYIDSSFNSGGSSDLRLMSQGREIARVQKAGFGVASGSMAGEPLSLFSVQSNESTAYRYQSVFLNDDSEPNIKVIVVKNDSGDSCQIYSDGDIYNDNDSYGQISSDVRMKERITDLPDDVLDRLLKIRPCNYYWREEVKFDSSEKKLGFIAQEIQKQFPDIVTGAGYGQEIGIEDPLTVTTSKLIPYLVKSIQLLEARVKKLESK